MKHRKTKNVTGKQIEKSDTETGRSVDYLHSGLHGNRNFKVVHSGLHGNRKFEVKHSGLHRNRKFKVIHNGLHRNRKFKVIHNGLHGNRKFKVIHSGHLRSIRGLHGTNENYGWKHRGINGKNWGTGSGGCGGAHQPSYPQPPLRWQKLTIIVGLDTNNKRKL